MKTTRVLLVLGAFVFFNGLSQAQGAEAISYAYNANDLDISEVALSSSNNHPLGDEVAKKMVLFKDRYTYTEEATPTSPVAKTVIHKPTIFNAVQKVERSLKKGVKKDEIDADAATKQMVACLNVALICANLNTIEIEKRLKAAKTPEQIIDVFEAVVLE